MSHGYVSVQWNRQKRVYDLAVWAGIILYLAVFMGVSSAVWSGPEALSPEIVMIRALGSCAFVMLTVILCIGPLARLSDRFLPLLYNRRHLGVSMFLIALAHGVIVLGWYHGFGPLNPLVALFTTDTGDGIPFQPLGFFALLILFLMAATSHDYWNANLGAPLWKALHMGVYLAYALIVLHVALGALQGGVSGFKPAMVGLSVLLVGGLHLVTALREAGRDRAGAAAESAWVDIGSWKEIPDGRAKTVVIGGSERIAVFRYDGNKIAAVGNACQHQNGPLGEGRLVDGCITCPWHGFQYLPENGRSPEPFTERIPTYNAKVEGDRILLDPNPLPPGTARDVAVIPDMPDDGVVHG
ncbi:MAG: ferric reductase-like transmembrane domain-containing protein [Sphingomonadales bacterium]|nr:ferric reductase-like transmembrane domain-containing protein [Sphingomonadales bacterium]